MFLATPRAEVFMLHRTSLGTLLLAVTFVATNASFALAQPRAEVGASLLSGVVGLGDDNVSMVGIPSGGFGIINPGVYASLFLGTRAAIEPQLGLMWASFDGESTHIANFVGQFDYFILGTSRSSPYVFGAAGVISMADEDYTPKSFGFGVGYRMLTGDRLTFRVDGRYTRFTSEFEGDEGDSLAFTVSIGGVFGRR
jgi:hypothetical protein